MNEGERAMLVGGFKRGELAVLRVKSLGVTDVERKRIRTELERVTERTGVEFLVIPFDMEIVGPPANGFLDAVRSLAFHARSTGGVAGRDEGLCAAIERVEALLPGIAGA